MGFFDIFKAKRTIGDKLEDATKIYQARAFPGGDAQIEQETVQLEHILSGKLNKVATEQLLKYAKILLTISENKSEDRIVDSILRHTGNSLNESEAKLVYTFISGISSDLYTGGDGSSLDEAIVINTFRGTVGIPAEYQWLMDNFGEKDKDWFLVNRRHGSFDTDKYYEIFSLEISDGIKKEIIFDITSFFGKG